MKSIISPPLIFTVMCMLSSCTKIDGWSPIPSNLLPATRLYSTVEKEVSSADDIVSNNKRGKREWFPVKPADALSPSYGYDTLVRSAYLRHILVASEEMANLIMDVYLKGGNLPDINDEIYSQTDGDIFTRLASDVSLCQATREDGGKVGWVDNPKNKDNDSNRLEKTNGVVSEIISSDVIQTIFEQRVKGGDILKVKADSDDNGWHIIRVDDLHIELQPSTMVSGIDSKNIINKKRKKLKGSGYVPLSPKFEKVCNNNGIEDYDKQSKTIYSVPNAKHYKILTAGCQMNVADSERIMGVLEGELGLKSLDSAGVEERDGVDPSLIATSSKKSDKSKATPDILLLNTCTIRDHAEQKVYDALGPYANLKRQGQPLAIVGKLIGT